MSSPSPQGHIVAMGGGGFSMEPDNPLLDDFVLSLVPKPRPRVCFIPTAAADSAPYLVNFYRAFSEKAIATDLTIFDPGSLARRPSRSADLAHYLAGQDILYVGGGNTVNLLVMWRAHGLDTIVADAWRQGKVLCGLSAGMLCWFRAGVTDSFGGMEPLHDGMGLIDASACPHYDNEPERRPLFHRLIREGMPAGYAADDGAALHFHGTSLVEAVSSRPKARAYRVQCVGSEIVETGLETRFLGRIPE